MIIEGAMEKFKNHKTLFLILFLRARNTFFLLKSKNTVWKMETMENHILIYILSFTIFFQK